MLSSPPVTQRDIAQACGVHPSTICLALNNSPSIPLETRQRIQLAAEELGYQPNAAARNLAYLRSERKGGGGLPIAWINQEERRNHWRVDSEALVYFEAARRRAGELGYHLEEIWASEPGMNVSRLIQIVRARGIEGVIFPVHRAFDFSLLSSGWSDFSTVGLNDHRLGEWIDVVCIDYYRRMTAILRQLGREGFVRIGLAMTPQIEASTNGLIHSCYLRHQERQVPAVRVPVCIADGSEQRKAAMVRGWIAEQRPDFVVCCDPALMEGASAMGGQVRAVSWHDAANKLGVGGDGGAAEVGVMAVDCIVEKARRFERGLGGTTRFHLIMGFGQEQPAVKVELEPEVA